MTVTVEKVVREEIDLLPCPLCGSEEGLAIDDAILASGPNAPKAVLRCKPCRLSLGGDDSKSIAIRWNSRWRKPRVSKNGRRANVAAITAAAKADEESDDEE